MKDGILSLSIGDQVIVEAPKREPKTERATPGKIHLDGTQGKVRLVHPEREKPAVKHTITILYPDGGYRDRIVEKGSIPAEIFGVIKTGRDWSAIVIHPEER